MPDPTVPCEHCKRHARVIKKLREHVLKRSSATLNLLATHRRQWKLTFQLGQRPCAGNYWGSGFHELWFARMPNSPCPHCKAEI